ncbi:MAG: glutamine--fructose-6-phosphate transaminase (isomerizing) [Firmicutes bacterium]|nr:glutamine--fructose-6-phosphate transaminase (isomerizing) [Bacillota bacterium]
MCGIVGYLGCQEAVPVLLEGLKKLEYRGYDSAGIAIISEQGLMVTKSKGKIGMLEELLNTRELPSCTVGIGHTRWATHGRPADHNSHPHTDCADEFAVVHNGIIENYEYLREWLTENGHQFSSETDTEVLPHLVEHFYQGDLEAAVRQMITRVEGSYAVVVFSSHEPEKLVAARKDSPLIVGLGQEEYFVASDIPAILNHTRSIHILEDGEQAVLTRNGVQISDTRGAAIDKEVYEVNWDAVAAEKGGFPHFMLKEINEQPKALRDTLTGRIAADDSRVNLPEINLTPEEVKQIRKVGIVACGTAYHAGIVGKYLIEKLARVPVEVDIASEFRYRDPLLDNQTLVIVVSQSGETADTLAALREAKRQGAKVLAITNVVGSSVDREADFVIHTWAGPEIAVASTKAYTTQLICMYLVALYLAEAREALPAEQIKDIISRLRDIPAQADQILHQRGAIEELARKYAGADNTFFIGRGIDYAVAMEGALKLKEISYIHAEAYAAGELKHGTLALIVEGIPVIALATQEDLYDKTMSNIKEVKAREATVIGLVFEDNREIEKSVDEVIRIPRTLPILSGVLSAIPLQLYAYYSAIARGTDVDQPRNLAKSVTVE